jgi:CheY-like chemotaxis protein/anti-anti-sigma regulatory factor
VVVVHFPGRQVSLDDTTGRIHDTLLALVDEPSESDLLLDFGNVVSLTGLMLGTLVGLHKRLLVRGRRLTIGHLSPQVHEVFTVLRLDRVLDLRLAGQEDRAAARDGRPGSPTGILVVDDETAVLCVWAARRRCEGHKVWLAGHGRQAIERFLRPRDEIGVVLLDVLTPGTGGPHTLTALQKLFPDARCCFLTGNPTPYPEEGLWQTGAVRVFRKPFALTEVIDALGQASRPPRPCQDRRIETPRKGV